MRIYLFLLFYLYFFNLYTQEKKEILFVGNSFTFYWNLPKLVEDMAKSRGLNWNVSQSTSSGATLEQHWNSKKGLKTISLIEKNDFDYIVLQDRSHNPIIQVDSTVIYSTKFINLSKSKQSIPLLFSTWFYQEYWEQKYPNNKIDLTKNPYPIEAVILKFCAINLISLFNEDKLSFAARILPLSTSDSENNICLCKLDKSITSSSTKHNSPTPDEVRKIEAEQPSPPNPIIATFADEIFF